VLDGFEQLGHRGLALALEDAVDGPAGVLEQLLSGERRAVAADEDERVGPAGTRQLREIDHLGDVRQVVAGERDHVRLPVVDEPEVILVGARL